MIVSGLLREVAKKNFIRENIKHLKQLQKKTKRDKKKTEFEVNYRRFMQTFFKKVIVKL